MLATSIATAITFPRNVDPQGDESLGDNNRGFYDRAYSDNRKDHKDFRDTAMASEKAPLSAKEQVYPDFTRAAAERKRISDALAEFVEHQGLQERKYWRSKPGAGFYRM